ncbi:MAG: hypothetical protein GOV01_00200 [Candidatus Altiarchaeota archaeon]|nr:hypothetical protein [Candidatus Altiarchaeota archaeon]
MEKAKTLMENFRAGKIELGKELTLACLSLFNEAFKRNEETFLKNRENFVLEILSRPIDPLTNNFLEAIMKAKTVKETQKVLTFTKEYLKDSRKKLIPNGSNLLKGKKTVMAIGYSEVLAEMIDEHKSELTVYVPELSLTKAGHKMASRLSANTILIPDCAVGYFIPSVDLVLTRSCCVSTSGLLGSSNAKSAAIIAEWHDKPFYMIAELLRIGESFVVNEHKWDVKCQNRAPLYDKVEPELVSGIVTEEGILTHESYIDKANEKKEEMIK